MKILNVTHCLLSGSEYFTSHTIRSSSTLFFKFYFTLKRATGASSFTVFFMYFYERVELKNYSIS